MKLATISVLGILLLGSFASMKAADPPGVSQVVMAFSGGSVYTSNGNICLFYPVLLGNLNLESLFVSSSGTPEVDKEHAYLIWVSDYSMVPVTPFQLKPAISGLIGMALVPTGTATIYFRPDPENRKWNNLTDRSTWGEPVATFVREAGLFQSIDGGTSGTVVLSSELVSSRPFKVNGKTFNFQDLMPQGMTCIEAGLVKGNTGGDDEAGTCVAIGRK
ncbi:MAG: hypothetical protein WCB12_01565 [Bryobacteraceae bacterium]